MTRFTAQDLADLLTGAVLYGSGGGGPVAMGDLMRTKILAQPVQPQIAEMDDVGDDDWVVIVAGVGSPDAAKDFDPSCAVVALECLEEKMGIRFGYVMAAEIGAGNSFMPIYVAAQMTSKGRDVKALDVAGSDRAVPSITMSSFAADGVEVGWFMVANHDHHEGARVGDAAEASGKMRAVITKPEYAQVAGLAIWPMQGRVMKASAVPRTFGKALTLGRALREAGTVDRKVAAATRLMGGKVLGRGTLAEFDSETSGSFDSGRAVVALPGGTSLIVLNKNENLLAWRSDLPHPVAIGPDLISYMCAETGAPFSNAEAKDHKGREVIVLASPASGAMRAPEIVEVFRGAMATMGGYPGPAVPLGALGDPET